MDLVYRGKKNKKIHKGEEYASISAYIRVITRKTQKHLFPLSLSTIAKISFPVAHKTIITQMRVRQRVWKKSRSGKQTYGFVHDVVLW